MRNQTNWSHHRPAAAGVSLTGGPTGAGQDAAEPAPGSAAVCSIGLPVVNEGAYSVSVKVSGLYGQMPHFMKAFVAVSIDATLPYASEKASPTSYSVKTRPL